MSYKKSQKSLLSMQALALLGQGLIGIFFPFFVQKSFGLSDSETLLWFAALQLAIGIVVYPLNFYCIKFFGVRRVMQFGLFFQTVFYALLGLGLHDNVSFWLLNISFILFIALFWPGFNYLSALATQDGSRGNYFGNFQILVIGVNLVAPLLTGFLLEINQEKWSIFVAILCFLGSLFLMEKIPSTGASLGRISKIFHSFKKIFCTSKNFPAFLAESVISATMWMLWPLYFKVVVGKFSTMGMVMAFMASLEIFTSKFFGRLSDRIGAKKMLQYGIWARSFDLIARVVYMKFNSLYIVFGIQGLAAFLGPIFQISAGTRIFEVGEEQSENLLDYLVSREMFLGVFRAIWIFLAGILVLYTGTIYLGLMFVVAGLFAFGFRRL